MQETVINRLSAYLDGELSDSERDTLEQQLAENETLRHELDKLRAVRDWLANYPGRRPSDNVWSSIETRIVAGDASKAAVPGTKKSLPKRIAARVAALPVISWFGSEGKTKRFAVGALVAVAVAGMGRQVYLEQLATRREESSRIRDQQLFEIVSETNWQFAATQLRGRDGQRFSITCPPSGRPGRVWGTDTYTDDSSICTAAVHAGLLTFDAGGVVTIEIRPGLAHYEGTSRNGVESRDYSSFGGSFVFIDTDSDEAPVGVRPLPISWGDNAVAYRGHIGRRVTFECPANGTERTIWGSDWYTDDSSICTSAVHAGLITFEDGGLVTIVMGAGRSRYPESERNGVESKWYEEWDGSFTFIDTPSSEMMADPVEWINWSQDAQPLRGWTGSEVMVHCPANGSPSTIWGTDVYTDDSSICTAAVHSGLITFERGGHVRVEIIPGRSRYEPSERFGVTSLGFGEWEGSFRVSEGNAPR